MDRNQTGNLLIGAGLLAGLGTLAYYFMQGGAEASADGATTSASGGSVPPSSRPAILVSPTAVAASAAPYAAWASNVPTYAGTTFAPASSAYTRPGSVERGY